MLLNEANVYVQMYKYVFVHFVQSLSLVQFFVTPWTVACQAPLFVGFPRQEYCSGLPFPSPGDLPYPGIGPASPLSAGGFFIIETPGKHKMQVVSKLWSEVTFVS